ncbi:MAG: transcription initiation factor IIB [Nitrososphaeraceae archaeon]
MKYKSIIQENKLESTSNNICKFCNKRNSIIVDIMREETVCSNCGIVSTDNYVYHELEYNINNEYDSENSACTFLSRYDRGFSTIISKKTTDVNGIKISPSMYSIINRLREYDIRIHSNTYSRNLKKAFEELYTLKHKLVLSHIAIEKVAYLYRKIVKKQIFRGRSIFSVLYATTYFVCKELGLTRTIKDIAKITGGKKNEIARIYRELVLELDLKVPIIDPIKCVSKISNKLEIDEKIKQKSIQLIKNIIKTNTLTLGKNPMALAGAVIYYISLKNKSKLTQRDIALNAGVAEVTIRKRVTELKNTGII